MLIRLFRRGEPEPARHRVPPAELDEPVSWWPFLLVVAAVYAVEAAVVLGVLVAALRL